MPSRLLDTNIVSYWVRKHPLYQSYRRHLIGYDLFISFQSSGELEEWSQEARWGDVKQQRFDRLVSSLTVLHSDETTCREWAQIRIRRRRQPISISDAWIAATALANGLDLVTHNPADFANIPGLAVISEAP